MGTIGITLGLSCLVINTFWICGKVGGEGEYNRPISHFRRNTSDMNGLCPLSSRNEDGLELSVRYTPYPVFKVFKVIVERYPFQNILSVGAS